MSSGLIKFITIFALLTAGAIHLCGQSADDRTSIFPKPGDKSQPDDRPLSFNENLEKLRIAKEKRDHDEMIERGQEAVKLSEDLEKAYTSSGRLTEKEIAKAASVEKLVKKIRSELGGDDDDEEDNTDSGGIQNATRSNSLSLSDAIKSLKETTGSLFDELKKTTRFSISAAAIQCSNSVIRLARFLRIAK